MSRGEARDARGSSARRTRSSSREASRAAVSPPVGKSVSMRVEPRLHDARDPRRAVGDRVRRALRVGSAARAESSPRESRRRPGCAPYHSFRRGAVNGAPASPRHAAGAESRQLRLSVCGRTDAKCARTRVAQKRSGASGPALCGRRTNRIGQTQIRFCVCARLRRSPS
jgi:hypothetical protein